MKPIRKAIIPAAGLGTRFLPATKAMPKEMLPLIDTPMIQYIVEEAIASGIEDILIITGKNKRAIEDHFDHSKELEQHLSYKQKFKELEEVQRSGKVEIHYIRQKEQKGLGHAIWCARKFIGDEPFAVLLGDDIIQAQEPGLSQLMKQFELQQNPIIGVQHVPATTIDRFGIIEFSKEINRLYPVDRLIEKPSVGSVNSTMAIIGRYILTPDIFSILETLPPGAGGEIQLTDALQYLLESRPIYGYAFEGKHYDVGEKLGFIKTTVELALSREDLRQDVLMFLEQILKDSR